jgi:hypothetical protein
MIYLSSMDFEIYWEPSTVLAVTFSDRISRLHDAVMDNSKNTRILDPTISNMETLKVNHFFDQETFFEATRKALELKHPDICKKLLYSNAYIILIQKLNYV